MGASAKEQEERPPVSLPRDVVPIVPVRDVVLFPGVILPVSIGRKSSVAAAQHALRSESQIAIVLQRDPSVAQPGPADLFRIGTTAALLRYITGADGAHHLVCQGEQRIRIVAFVDDHPFLAARIERIVEDDLHTAEIDARVLLLKELVGEVLTSLPQAPAELNNAIQQVKSASALTDLVASFMDLEPPQKQEILETLDIQARLDRLLGPLQERVRVLRISKEISHQTQEAMEGAQREYVLRQQMKTIQKELGESDERAEEIAELDRAITEAKMPEEAEVQARKELKRLERMAEASGEYPMVRTYLDWLIEMPWSVETEDRLDLNEARRILDEDHFGLDKIKRRILEYLAVRKLNPTGKSPILCFTGPPGVGKTSLGHSIARATGRHFVRVSLGGVHDEAEIRGHRRTYIGALPGNIIQAIRKAGAHNCVMMLDEIDKLSASFHGDPGAALLEVLDPEQNATFRDNYLGVAFDLSRVMFITTANMLDTIPGPLRDRLEVIALPGYTEEEKLQIARRYLVDRQRANCGLTAAQCDIADDAIRVLIHDYTREAGVRNLEREIGAVCRHVAMRVASGDGAGMRIDAGDLAAIIGPRRFESELAMRTSVPGVATGLAWTPVGGDILFIEASRAPGSGKLTLTGQLGDVMKESAQAALSLVKARSEALHIESGLFDKSDLHIHVPAGATPKDGPSAGVAMFVALVSLLTNQPVHHEVAMTGEISLRGLVLPVGGIKEKVLAAANAGISKVLLPERNRKDMEEIPPEICDRMQFAWLEKVEDALHETLPEGSDAGG